MFVLPPKSKRKQPQMNRGGELDAGLLEGGLTLDKSRTKLRTGLLSEGTPDELYELDFSERFLEFLNKYLLFDITKNQ
ncbi:unnamed protein product [Rhizophagus irregularis]|nr:unnamed protein product [Rhizophagus irregularis]